MPSALSKVFIRAMAIFYDDIFESDNPQEYQFSYVEMLDIYSKWEALIHNTTINEILEHLERDDFICPIERDSDNNQIIVFSLTDKGLMAGLPEKFPSSLLNLNLGYAVTFIFGTLGLLGTPFILASLFDGVIDWSSLTSTLINIWQKNISIPINDLIKIPVQFFGISNLPKWFADYFILGLLINKTDTISNEKMIERNPLAFIEWAKGSEHFIIKSIKIIIWPVFLTQKLIFFPVMTIMLLLFRRITPSELLFKYDIKSIMIGTFFYVFPVISFSLLYLFNLSMR